MKLTNSEGHSVYVNTVRKNDKYYVVIKSIGDTYLRDRDKKRVKSRSFLYEYQAYAYLRRNGFFE